MAHQVLPTLKEIVLPYIPEPTDNCESITGKTRKIEIESIEVASRFEGTIVDAVILIKGLHLVLYMTHPSREAPMALSMPVNKRCGVLGIVLTTLIGSLSGDGSATDARGPVLSRQKLTDWLVYDTGAKYWIYHPRQRQRGDSSSSLLVRYQCAQCMSQWFGGYNNPREKICHKCKSAKFVQR
jgi:hypothetical protein